MTSKKNPSFSIFLQKGSIIKTCHGRALLYFVGVKHVFNTHRQFSPSDKNKLFSKIVSNAEKWAFFFTVLLEKK